jgi:uncharacterized protein (TIGR02300 family)
VAKPEWGNRYVCFSCGCKYYDLNRPESLCPRCGSDPREAVLASRTPPRQTREPSSPEEEEVDQEIVDETLDVGLESAAVLDEGENSEEEETEEEEDEF